MKFFLQALVIIHLISLLPSYAYSADANIVAGCRHAVNRADGKEIPSDSATFFQLGICNGFIRGLEEAFMFWREAEPDPVLLICIPEKVSYGQATRIFVKYLNEHPERLHLDAMTLVMESFGESFPCGQSKLE